jgi:hypothetical protein
MEKGGQGYRGFGSFHSENVEYLIRQPEESYVPPELPIGWDDLLPGPGAADLPSFGHEMRDAHFLLDRDWTFINHGAFGVQPSPAHPHSSPFSNGGSLGASWASRRALADCGGGRQQVAPAQRTAAAALRRSTVVPVGALRVSNRRVQLQDSARQHHFSRATRCAQIVWALRQLAAEVKAAPDEVAFVPNATTGLNTVIKSIHLNAGDEVPLSTPLSCLPRVLTRERLCVARCTCSTLAMDR